MDERVRPNMSIEEYLREEDVQKRIHKNMARGYSEARVTIGRAARLFGFTENQLRVWEDRKLLKPIRQAGGQRHYSYEELNKLAIIRELIDAHYTPGEIPTEIENIWASVSASAGQKGQMMGLNGKQTEPQSIDVRIDNLNQQLFWRYFVSHVLRMSLMLICEGLDTIAGIVLPLTVRGVPLSLRSPKDLQKAGMSLIGWLGQNGSFSTFLDIAPSFEYPHDFRLLPFRVGKEDPSQEIVLPVNASDFPGNNALIVVQRKVKPLNLSCEVVDTVQRFLALIYKFMPDWQSSFAQDVGDYIDPVLDFNTSINLPDNILNRFADMIVSLGDREDENQQRWQYCSILLPKDSILPLQQRSLFVQAQSEKGPYKVGVDTFYPYEASKSINLRAFQSGHIIYRSDLASEDSSIDIGAEKFKIGSDIAVPIGGEDGRPLAVLYVASEKSKAFTEADERLLRITCRILEELLRSYLARQRVTKELMDLLANPGVVDKAFKDFGSETEFRNDIKEILSDIKKQKQERMEQANKKPLPGEIHEVYGGEQEGEAYWTGQQDGEYEDEQQDEWVAIIAIDIDNQSSRANQYGELVTRNLSREVGLRIQGHFRAILRKPETCRLYHLYADRFYILMKGVDDKQALEDAQRLNQSLSGSYRVDVKRSLTEQTTLAGGMLILHNVTVRLGVNSYKYSKLEQILGRYSDTTAISEVTEKIFSTLDHVLKMGMDEGGDVVLAWDHESRSFRKYPPLLSPELVEVQG